MAGLATPTGSPTLIPTGAQPDSGLSSNSDHVSAELPCNAGEVNFAVAIAASARGPGPFRLAARQWPAVAVRVRGAVGAVSAKKVHTAGAIGVESTTRRGPFWETRGRSSGPQPADVEYQACGGLCSPNAQLLFTLCTPPIYSDDGVVVSHGLRTGQRCRRPGQWLECSTMNPG
jgi:hypothetical protein